MKNPDPGYLLPDGEAYTDDFICQLIYIPNKDEYYRAMLGAILYMGTWTAWERDDDKRGKDAAQAWREANELTLGCWRMTNCLDDINLRLDAILLLMATKKDCCTSTITYSPTFITTTTIVPGEGVDPDYYGETEVADWDEWLEHLCYQAHEYVDGLIRNGETIDNLLSAGGLVLESWSSIMSWLHFAGIILPIYLGEVVDWLSDFLESAGDSWFDNVATDIEDGRDDIVCAIMQGLSLHDALEDILSPSLAWTLFYSLINYDGVQATLYEGGIDDVFLPTEKRDDCQCDLPEGYNWLDAEDIQFTLHPDTFGRLNSAQVTLPEIKVGYKVATSASWGCMAYPAGALTVNAKNSVYQTLAVRFTIIANTGNSHPYYEHTCRDNSPGHQHIWFYTLDVAEGIDATWAAANADTWRIETGGHAKRAIDYSWPCGETLVGDTVPGATPVYFTVKLEHLVWVP